VTTFPLTAPLRGLARALSTLCDRVREALAGEVSRAAGEAVRDAVGRALAGGDSPRDPRDPTDGSPGPTDDNSWDDDGPWGEPPPAPTVNTPSTPPRSPGGVLAAATAAVTAGRWWLARRGSPAGAAAIGVLVLVATLVGGPAARAGVAVLSAAADIAAAADALGTASARLTSN
jgi:hypothetical protein